jgi:hypothetical protein
VAWLDDGWADHISIVRGKDGPGADARDVEQRPVAAELPLLKELRTFVEHVGGGPAPRSSAEEGARVVECIARLRDLAGLPRCP